MISIMARQFIFLQVQEPLLHLDHLVKLFSMLLLAVVVEAVMMVVVEEVLVLGEKAPHQ